MGLKDIAQAWYIPLIKGGLSDLKRIAVALETLAESKRKIPIAEDVLESCYTALSELIDAEEKVELTPDESRWLGNFPESEILDLFELHSDRIPNEFLELIASRLWLLRHIEDQELKE